MTSTKELPLSLQAFIYPTDHATGQGKLGKHLFLTVVAMRREDETENKVEPNKEKNLRPSSYVTPKDLPVLLLDTCSSLPDLLKLAPLTTETQATIHRNTSVDPATGFLAATKTAHITSHHSTSIPTTLSCTGSPIIPARRFPLNGRPTTAPGSPSVATVNDFPTTVTGARLAHL
jgi:hypothetical protein